MKIVEANKSDKQAIGSIMKLLDKVKSLKKALSPKSEEGRAIVELYSLKISEKAEERYEKGHLDSTTMRLFLMSSYLMQVTEQFKGGISEDILEKQNEANTRALEIRNLKKKKKTKPPPPKKEEKKPRAKKVQKPIGGDDAVNISGVGKRECDKAHKYLEYARSSLQFNDLKTARKYLIDSINTLGGM